MKYSILLALSLALVLPLHAGNKKAGGQAKSKASPQMVFKKKDKDGDKSLSKDEFTAKSKDAAKAANVFIRKDKNNDGKLSLGEFAGKAGKAKAKGKGKGNKAKAGKAGKGGKGKGHKKNQ